MSDPPAEGDINFFSVVSEVLRDIGVTDDIVKTRRKGWLLREAIFQVKRVMINGDISVYFFGSQSEGTTTICMDSDIDELCCNHQYNVIQDLSDWKANKTNLMIIQDGAQSPGYCHLQLLLNDKPQPIQHVPDQHYTDRNGQILMKNTIFHGKFDVLGNNVQHGPATTLPSNNIDIVGALHCTSWPTEASDLFKRGGEHAWPTEEMKDECRKAGCFIVPVGSRVNGYNELEWRISTHHAERCLMFSLEITPLECYILIKLLLKTHINRGCVRATNYGSEGAISSYMCKTVLMHCVKKKPATQFWQDKNIIHCLNYLLRELYVFVQTKTCPHFIISGNNLMADRISDEHQQLLLENIQHIIDSNGRVLLEIEMDDIGMRLQRKLDKTLDIPCSLPTAESIHRYIASEVIDQIALYNIVFHRDIIKTLKTDIQTALKQLLCCFNRCMWQYLNSCQTEQEAYKLMLPLFCTTIASLRATEDITLNRPVSSISLFKLGLISDVSSGWLKLATVYYSSGDFNATESTLRRVEQKYDRRYVMPVCGCYPKTINQVPGFGYNTIRHCVSYCVMYMQCERNIVPQEMQQEYTRSTAEQKQGRTFLEKQWMDNAVVDSLPYLYFLQYKTYGRLGNCEEQQRSLNKFRAVIHDEPNLSHRETAVNLFGQCMEEIGFLKVALICYDTSLQIRPQNNAAQFHKAKLLAQNMTSTASSCLIV